MSTFSLEVFTMLGQTIMKVVPVTIVLAIVFSVLAHFWACNPGLPWWRKRELVTDICYWFFVPVFARVFRIGLLVLGASVVFNIHEADDLIAFYDNGHGPFCFWCCRTSCCIGCIACSMAAASGNIMPSITPRKIWSGFRRRASIP
jgi:hypothetical protein